MGLTSPENSRPRLLAIDDLADRAHKADWLLDQNFFGDFAVSRYADLLPDHCRIFLGPDYALLGPEYRQIRDHLPSRRELRRILVFYGGIDILGLTERALSILSCREFNDIAIDVVLPRVSSTTERISAMAAERAMTNLYQGLPSLAGLIARADLAIGASGATTWERVCLGCPCITTVIAENQKELSQFLQEKDLIYTLSQLDSRYESSLKAGIRYFSESGVLSSRSELLSSLCLGEGAARIADAILR
jgi:UDP-2,4-diacetamido-2,4,6-trideoxy-beta-L-altropyranose hydrolase